MRQPLIISCLKPYIPLVISPVIAVVITVVFFVVSINRTITRVETKAKNHEVVWGCQSEVELVDRNITTNFDGLDIFGEDVLEEALWLLFNIFELASLAQAFLLYVDWPNIKVFRCGE